MTTSTSKYSGELRTHSVHTQSGETYITDAPTDNEGKGEAFSPTDIVATSLANCMMTIMGIVSKRKGLIIEGTEAKIDKFMGLKDSQIPKIYDKYFPKIIYYDKNNFKLKFFLNNIFKDISE